MAGAKAEDLAIVAPGDVSCVDDEAGVPNDILCRAANLIGEDDDAVGLDERSGRQRDRIELRPATPR